MLIRLRESPSAGVDVPAIARLSIKSVKPMLRDN